MDICSPFDVSNGTAANILKDDLVLSKQAARLVLNEPSKANKTELQQVYQCHLQGGEANLRSIIAMDETIGPFHTPECKKASSCGCPRGPGPR